MEGAEWLCSKSFHTLGLLCSFTECWWQANAHVDVLQSIKIHRPCGAPTYNEVHNDDVDEEIDESIIKDLDNKYSAVNFKINQFKEIINEINKH